MSVCFRSVSAAGPAQRDSAVTRLAAAALGSPDSYRSAVASTAGTTGSRPWVGRLAIDKAWTAWTKPENRSCEGTALLSGGDVFRSGVCGGPLRGWQARRRRAFVSGGGRTSLGEGVAGGGMASAGEAFGFDSESPIWAAPRPRFGLARERGPGLAWRSRAAVCRSPALRKRSSMGPRRARMAPHRRGYRVLVRPARSPRRGAGRGRATAATGRRGSQNTRAACKPGRRGGAMRRTSAEGRDIPELPRAGVCSSHSRRQPPRRARSRTFATIEGRCT